MKDILNKIMKMFKKILQFLGIIKKEKKLSSFDGITPMPHLTNKNEEEKEELDKLNEDTQVDVPLINIVPIPNLDKDKIDVDQFKKEVEKSKNTDELNKKIQEEVPVINITPIPDLPVDKVKVKKVKPVTKKKPINKQETKKEEAKKAPIKKHNVPSKKKENKNK